MTDDFAAQTPFPPDGAPLKFSELDIGDTFDWLAPGNETHNSFYDRCVKIGLRRYRSIVNDINYNVGSIRAQVYHVKRRA